MEKDMLRCPVCKSAVEEDCKEVYVASYNQKEYKRYECEKCGLHWWEPLEISLDFYENEVLDYYANLHNPSSFELEENHKVFFRLFPKHVRGRLLDVGCGNGIFLKAAKEAGFEVWGIDFDIKSVETAKKLLGVDTIYHMSLEEFYDKYKDVKFDVITMFEVLEHQDKPMEFINTVRNLLKEGGYIAGSVPNKDGEGTKIFNQKLYKGDFPPNHLLRFGHTSLANYLKSAGFKISKIEKFNYNLRGLLFLLECKFFGKKLQKTNTANIIKLSKKLLLTPFLLFCLPKILKKDCGT
ncbi:MAG: hypothetical protein C0170_03485, partial [Hydrogenobaculum sp.]